MRKELGFVSLTALALNDILGGGVLVTPSIILEHAGSVGLSLLLWLVGGIITTLAAFCYLELALLVKKSGSSYVYIKEAYSFGRKKPWMEGIGSLLSFLMVWTDMIIVQPVAGAVSLRVIGRYICRPFFIGCEEMPTYAIKMFALVALSRSVFNMV